MEGLSGASFPFGIAISPEDFDIPLPLYGSGHQGHPSTGLPVAYNSSPPLYPPNMEHPPSVDENAEWMAALETIPIHDPAGNTSTERPIRPEAIANEQSLPPEERFNDLVVVDDSLFTGRVEIPVLAPVLMSPVQNDPGLGDFIASLGGSLDNFSMETPERSQNSFPLLGTLLHSRVILFPKAALDMSPLSTRSAFGSNHLSSGSLVTEPIHTPLDFPQETTMAATPAFSNTPSSWDPFVTTREITTIHPYPCPPISYINTISPIYPPPNPSIPPTDGFPPPLYILPSSIPRPRHHQHRPRPVVCEKHFKPSPADAPFHALMNRARADLNFCEPSELKRDFCKRNKGPCPNQKRHPSPCFTIRVGRLSNQCRTETVAVREIRNVLGLCWTCKSW